ncbi:hypothetical protein [Methylophaga sp.]|uniref:hypothetical protein n=1 Tax=Methylophaga sp. TaxID=2024840 RepID=UPI0025F0C5AA|nr:hypothetical protein [Methylophaga sp.]
MKMSDNIRAAKAEVDDLKLAMSHLAAMVIALQQLAQASDLADTTDARSRSISKPVS